MSGLFSAKSEQEVSDFIFESYNNNNPLALQVEVWVLPAVDPELSI